MHRHFINYLQFERTIDNQPSSLNLALGYVYIHSIIFFSMGEL